MPRRARIEFEGAFYHVLDRGDHREAICLDDGDREMFLATLAQACGRTGWRVHAYVLMGNHYHILLETPRANLVKGMHWLQCTYTARFNRRHRLAGHLFQGRYKALVVNPDERHYLVALSDYIHLNPVRARMLGETRLADYRWSSYPAYVGLLPKRAAWLTVETVLAELGWSDGAADRRAYSRRMKERAEEGFSDEAGRREELRQGWCLGGPEFRDRMLSLLDGASDRIRHCRAMEPAVRQEHDEAHAERMLESALATLQMSAEDLPLLRKSDPRKIAIGKWIREATAVSNVWMASKLAMGHPSRASRYCSLEEANEPEITNMLQQLKNASKCTT